MRAAEACAGRMQVLHRKTERHTVAKCANQDLRRCCVADILFENLYSYSQGSLK